MEGKITKRPVVAARDAVDPQLPEKRPKVMLEAAAIDPHRRGLFVADAFGEVEIDQFGEGRRSAVFLARRRRIAAGGNRTRPLRGQSGAASRRRLYGRSSVFCPRPKSPGSPKRSAPRKSGPATPSRRRRSGRRGEIVNLRWEPVDFEHECRRLPDRKTGAKVVYLNAPAREFLQRLPSVVKNPRVILGTRVESASAAIDNVWPNVRKTADSTAFACTICGTASPASVPPAGSV